MLTLDPKNVGYTRRNYSKTCGSDVVEIGEELASRRIRGGPEVVEIVFFVLVMVDGCGRQEESGVGMWGKD